MTLSPTMNYAFAPVSTARRSRFRSALLGSSIAGRINRLIVFAVLCQIVIVIYQLGEYRSGLLGQRKHELVNLTSIALSLVQSEYEDAKAGRITVQTAQENAEKKLKSLRYNKDDYFWINDMFPRMVMHPVRADLNGQDLREYKDPNGKRLFVAFVDIVKRQGAGFVDYRWPKPGADKPQPKLSYVVGFEPWNWVIGTGVYVDDLDALFIQQLETEGAIVLGMVAFCASISLLVGRHVSKSIKSMSATMEALASGQINVRIDDETGAAELDSMGGALLVFQQNAVDKIALEQDVAAQQIPLESPVARPRPTPSRRNAIASSVHSGRLWRVLLPKISRTA